jgi:hypothetical protein
MKISSVKLAIVVAAAVATGSGFVPPTPALAAPDQSACEALATNAHSWPDKTLRILSAKWLPAGTTASLGFGNLKSPPLPAHCDVMGIMHERTGQDGDHYAIRFHLRLPEKWNGRFLFEGGGGSDGNTGSALGNIGGGAPPAIASGYAVVSDDSGHNNQINNDPAVGGTVSFGRDEQARADYGHSGQEATYDDAQSIIASYYDKSPDHSYFVGCSKGGQEGLSFAERRPDAFDGILAGSPGMSLPRAALGHPWEVQAFAAVVSGGKTSDIPVSKLGESVSDADLALARKAILAACDADDGVKDGLVGNFEQCTSKKVMPQLRKVECKGEKTNSCLSATQISAIEKFYEGPHNSKGEALYVTFPWDAGLADAGWRAWTIGSAPKGGNAGRPGGGLSIGVTLGAGALAEVFSTPPKILAPGPQAAFDYLLHYDFDKDAPLLYATNADFPRSAWDEINARSPDIDGFKKHGGKLIIYQGVSDPIFSIHDTAAWLSQVDTRLKGHADDVVRLFPVPGMGHCRGGPATDQFDGFGALVNWVEKGQAPSRIEASAGRGSPWPGRTRPLCPYPEFAKYTGKGSIEQAANFVCAKPGSK